MPWGARELELEKYIEPRVDRTLCQVKGCSNKRRDLYRRMAGGRRRFCAAHLKRISRRGSLLVQGTTTLFGLNGQELVQEEKRDPYGADNSSKTEYVAGLIRKVDRGDHHTQT